MISSNKISHELTNNVEAILNALDAVEIKLESKDIKGALQTLNLIKDKKSAAQATIKSVHQYLETTDQLELDLLEYNEKSIQRAQSILEKSPEYTFKISGNSVSDCAGKETLDALPPNFDRNKKLVFAITQDANDIGIIDILMGYPNEDTAFIGLLLLVESAKGKGLGEQAYKKLEKQILVFQNISKIKLSVVESNIEVEKFWKKMGFQRTGEIKPYSNGNVVSNSILFERVIRESND